MQANPGTRWALVNDTMKDVRDVMVLGESGICTIAPPWFKPVYEPSKALVTCPNGSIAYMYSAEAPELLRGPQFNGGWGDELPKWKYNQEITWDNLQFCMRLQPNFGLALTTTPRMTETYERIIDDKMTAVSFCTTFENESHLDPIFIAKMKQRYEGTRIGRQELFAERLRDNPGSLFKADWIDISRLKDGPPVHVQLQTVVVAIDPNAGSQDPESGAETGIVVVARGSDGHGYILGDYTTKGSPGDWAKAALRAYERHHADLIVAERNNGGTMVEHTVRTIPSDPGVHPAGKDVRVKLVWASRGKTTRAEPVASAYEGGKIHHCGIFNALEGQMCRYDPTKPDEGLKDRMDALVWGCTEAMILGGNYCPPMGGGSRPQIVVPSFRDHAAPSPRFSR
jgi:phage terminase large subunit-like protein